MKVRYSRRAASDLSSVHRYISEHSPGGAHRIMTGIYASIEFIKRNPYGAEQTTIGDVRVKVVSKYRFKIFYRVIARDDAVEIVHVRHASRRAWSGEEE